MNIERIYKDYEGFDQYRTSCACTHTDDTCDFSVVRDDEHISLEVTLKCKSYTNDYTSNVVVRTFKTAINRIRACFVLLFTGYITMESGFLFRDESQIDDFCNTIQLAKDKAKGGYNNEE